MHLLILIAAFIVAFGVALFASPWLLRETYKDCPVRRIRLRLRALRGLVGPTNYIFVKPYSGAAAGVIESRRLCFGLLLVAFAILLGTFVSSDLPQTALGLTILVPKARLVDRFGRELPDSYAFKNAVRSQASSNPILTNYAVGLAQDLQSALAEFLAPTVVVPSTIGHFKKFDDKNAFQVYNTARAVGGTATRIEFESSDPTYNCKPQALEATIDDAERDAAGDTDPLALEQSKVKTLVSSAVLSHETQVTAATLSAITAEAGLGVYSDATKDPIAEIDGLIEAMTTATGMMPNRLAIGIGAWRVVRNHPKVIARQPGAALIGTTTSQFASMLLNPGIDIKVGVLSQDTTKFGKAKSASNIFGAEILLFIASPSPTQYDPSFAKTFMGKRGGITAVRQYRDESARSDVLAADWSRDIQITGTACGKRITLS